MSNDAPLLSSAAAFGADLAARVSTMMMTTMTMTRMRGGSG